jgi:hypothetical protein
VAISLAGLVDGMDLVVDAANSVVQGGLTMHEEFYADWWRLERTMQRPTSNISGGRGALASEVIWSNRPLPAQARLLDPETVSCR